MSLRGGGGGRARAAARRVELRLRADVPLAFCLSGGVDSAALIAIAEAQLGYDVHGFTDRRRRRALQRSDNMVAGGARRRRAPHR